MDRRVLLTAAVLALACAGTAAAQDSVSVAEDEVSANSGRVAVNIVAGDANQQAGVVSIAIGDVAVNAQSLDQVIETPNRGDRQTDISIQAGAFSDNSGLLSLNATAGNQNQSANLASLTIYGSAMVSDQMLAQSRAQTAPATSSAHSPHSGNDTIAIDDAAFAGNSGLVQMNVVGGERNSSANTFALSVSAGGDQ